MARRQLSCPIVGVGISLTKVGLEAGFQEHSFLCQYCITTIWISKPLKPFVNKYIGIKPWSVGTVSLNSTRLLKVQM